MHRFLFAAAPLAFVLASGLARAAPVAGPTCAAVQAAFATGSYESREAIVDALQDHLKAAGVEKPLGRDGKVQAIVLAVTRCNDLGAGDFMAALDHSAAQVAQERAHHRSED